MAGGVRVWLASLVGGGGHNCNHLWKVSSRTVTTFGFSFLKIPSVAGGQSLQGTKTRSRETNYKIWKESGVSHTVEMERGPDFAHKIMLKINCFVVFVFFF